MNIIVAYCEAWDTSLCTSKHHYIKRLALDGHRVLYIEVPISLLKILKNPICFYKDKETRNRLKSLVQRVDENIWTMSGVYPLPYHKGFMGVFDLLFWNRLNQRFFFYRLKKALKRLNFESSYLIAYYPMMVPILNKLNCQRVFFHMVDEWQGLSGIPNSMAKLTQKMLRRADVTVVSSQRLYDRYQPYAKKIELLRHGTDVKLFSSVREGICSEDERLKNISHPRIGYYGALHKIDFDLVATIAKQRPEWSFIFMGPVKGQQGIGDGKKLPENVYFLDPVKREWLPSFLAGIDVFWMPYVINELTHCMCSIKIYEVLSAGLRMVISSLDEAMQMVAGKSLFASNANEHEKCLLHVLSVPYSCTIADVGQYDWSVRYVDFLLLLRGK